MLQVFTRILLTPDSLIYPGAQEWMTRSLQLFIAACTGIQLPGCVLFYLQPNHEELQLFACLRFFIMTKVETPLLVTFYMVL